MARVAPDAKMARLVQVLVVYNVLVVKPAKQKLSPVTLVNRVNREHMQPLEQKHVFNVLLDIHKLKKVKQDVLNVYREKSTITKVVFSVMNVTLVNFPKHQVENRVFSVLVDIRKLKKVKQGVLDVYPEESIITMVTKIALNVL